MAEKKFRRLNSIDAQGVQFSGFTSTKPSLTVPNQVLELRQVVERFRRGQAVQVFQGGYNELIPPGLEYMDKLDKADALRQARDNVQKIRTALRNKQQPQNEPVPPTDVQGS